MPVTVHPMNGRTHHAVNSLPDLVGQFRKEKPDAAALFRLFAELAHAAGYDDLHAEFTLRAAASTPTPPPPTHTPPSEAERHQQRGCHLIRERRFAEAETAFRQAIQLDPKLSDAHGNPPLAR